MKKKKVYTFEYVDNIKNINWDELSHLYKIANLGIKSSHNLEIVFLNSKYKYFIYLGGNLIGAGRALSDGIDCSYICDVAIHPNYQGLSLGKKIVKQLSIASKEHKKILLYSMPGKELFYEKLGFSKMKSAMAIFKNQSEAEQIGLIEKRNDYEY